MNSFDHHSATSSGEALALLAQAPRSARIIAGGTDLLTLMKAGLAAPDQLIDLKPARALRYLRFEADGALQIGALATLADIERSAEVAARLPILAQAVRDAATPQLRAAATVGGNLLQRPRCWYYRGQFDCWLKGGTECFAREGQNKYHAIFDQSPCVAVHPSDLAPALIALDAQVVLERRTGTGTGTSTRTVAVAELLRPPEDAERVEHRLAPDELLTAIQVPAQPADAAGVYLKAMDRRAWAFALVGAACQIAQRAGHVDHVRLVLGGVANVPLRVGAAEELLVGQQLTPALAATVAERFVAAAQPLAHNGYKVALARELARRALLAAAGVAD
jgi:xanthine dehydrogenase YagS FAD-binding subunit